MRKRSTARSKPEFISAVILASCLGIAVPLTSVAADMNQTRRAELDHLLRQDCGSCHGMTMKGGLGPALLPENLHGKSDAFLVYTILEGRSGTAMPPWRELLSEPEARYLVELLREGPAR